MTFKEKLCDTIEQQQSNLCVGLDPDQERFPQFLNDYDDPVQAFLKMVIEATGDLACAFKPNFAFFEALGERGWGLLREAVQIIPERVVTIADAKRGDIGNTAKAYARAIFDDLQFDSTTLNPLMGYDALEPFLDYPGKGIFALVLTSNPGAADFQMLETPDGPLYQQILRKLCEWDKQGSIGAVVGATRPEMLQDIRSIAPGMPLLLPGIGSQGGDLEATIANAAPTADSPFLVNVSRGILYPDGNPATTDDFQKLVREQALHYRDSINQCPR